MVTSAAAAIVVTGSLVYQPSHAQTTAQTAAQGTAQGTTQAATQGTTQATANECLGRPGTTTPRGSHWYYRIERPSGRKCWYLGSADAKVRRAAAAERKDVPTPAPRPPQEELPAEETAADTAAPVAPETTAQDMAAAPANPANSAGANGASATGLAAAWPAVPDAGDSADRDATPAADNDTAEPVVTAEAQPEQAEMPLVWPPPEQAGLAQSFDSTPGVASLVIFLAAAGAFVAIAFRAVLQFWSGWFAPRAHRPVITPAAPIIRPRAAGRPSSSERFAPEGSIEAMTEPTIARLREIAARWETPRHMPGAPRVAPAACDELQDGEREAPAPRRRSAVA